MKQGSIEHIKYLIEEGFTTKEKVIDSISFYDSAIEKLNKDIITYRELGELTGNQEHAEKDIKNKEKEIRELKKIKNFIKTLNK